MSEFHDVYPDYERMAQHDESAGKGIRKKLWRVFWLLLAVTIIEVVVGLYQESLPFELEARKLFLKFFFIGFTLLKAAYIVMVFMHLGHEKKWMKWMILIPYATFIIYLVIMMTIGEGNYVNKHRHGGPADQTEAPAATGGEHH